MTISNWIVHKQRNAKIFSNISVFIIHFCKNEAQCNTSIYSTIFSCYISSYKNIWIWIITKFDLITFVSNLMLESFSFPSPCSALFWSLITYCFLVANFLDSLSVSFNKFTIFWVSVLYIVYIYTTFTDFCENLKVASSGFSMIKNIVASCSFSLLIKLTCCFKSRLDFLIQFTNPTLLQLTCNVMKTIHNLINYLFYSHYFFPFQ